MMLFDLRPQDDLNICFLTSFYANATTTGTGFLIGPRVVLTAAHNLFDPLDGRGGFAQALRVQFPGTSSLSAFDIGPNDYDTSSPWKSRDASLDKVTRGMSAFDYGVIRLPQSIDSVVTPMAFAVDNAQLGRVNVAGFPGAENLGTFKGAQIDTEIPAGPPELAAFVPSRLFYALPTLPGMSGGPVWRDGPAGPIACGIHTSLANAFTATGVALGSAVRLSQSVVTFINQSFA
jgi:V8-like Glu-specific endopeptidase